MPGCWKTSDLAIEPDDTGKLWLGRFGSHDSLVNAETLAARLGSELFKSHVPVIFGAEQVVDRSPHTIRFYMAQLPLALPTLEPPPR